MAALDGLGYRAIAILRRRHELAQLVLVLGERDASVEVDLQRLLPRRTTCTQSINPGIDPNRSRGRALVAGELATASSSISTSSNPSA